MTVHFQSIVEKFTPHDTIFSFTSSAELKDTKLSAACSLHTASASVKSSTDSLRPPALSEIAEDAQENQPGCPDDQENHCKEPSLAGEANRPRPAISKYSDHQDFPRATSARRTLSPAHSTRTIRNTDKALPPTPPDIDHKKSYSRSTYEGDRLENRPSLESRFSLQSTRPATRDHQSVYEYKPKIKLGPRPSTDSATRSHILDSPRPVSTLPSSVRVPARKAASTRPKSQHPPQSSREMIPLKTALSPPLPVVPIQTLDTSHPKSNVPITPTRSMQPKSPAITPEKRRLMKALQLRQKQLAAQALKSNFGSELSPSEAEPGKGEAILETTVDITDTKNEYRKSEATMSEGSEIVQVFIDDVTKCNFNIESSPISIVEPSDGQSTQASSITDEEISKVESKSSAWGSLSQADEHDDRLFHSPVAVVNIDLDHSIALASFSVVEPAGPCAKPDGNLATTSVEPVDPRAVPLPPADEIETHDLISQRDSLGEQLESEPFIQSTSVDLSPEPNIGHLHDGVDGDPHPTRPSTSDTSHRGALGEVLGRHNQTASLKRVSTPENSEDHFLSDDSFMEELRSATVQEAKPMSVSLSKSPIAPVFPRRPSDQKVNEAGQGARSVSNPIQDMRKEDQMETSPTGLPHSTLRSLSASHHLGNGQTQQASTILLKKVGVSSGISQRIKALEQLSSRPTSPSAQGPSSVNPAGPSPALVSFRKVSLQSPPRSTGSNESMGSKIRQKISSPSMSSSSGAVYLNPKEKSLDIKTESKSKKSQSDSISVTATIIRNPRNKVPAGPVDLAEPNAMDLCRSPLVVEHQSGRKSPTPPAMRPPRSRFAKPRSISSSSTEHRSETAQATRRDSLTSKRSVTSGRESEVDLPRSISDTSINGVTGPDGSKEEKRESRKSRLFKRMSGISSASRRSIVQALNPTMKEGPIVEHHETVYEAPKFMAAFGDVNVQFPDTLVSTLCNLFHFG